MPKHKNNGSLIPFTKWFHYLNNKVLSGSNKKGSASSLPPPRFLFVHVNKRCNLRCRHCDYWKKEDIDKNRYIRGERMERLLREFSVLSPAGKVVICGGEKLLDPDDVFLITATCRELGLRAIGVTNGTLIENRNFAERLIREGPHEISVSLNSHREDLHDHTRGVPGAFSKAVRAVRLLLEARAKTGSPETRIYIMGLIFSSNYKELEEFYEFVLNTVGADKLKLNFLQPSFGHETSVDRFFAEHSRMDSDLLMSNIDRCDQRFGLGLNPFWKENVAMYCRSLGKCRDIEKGWWTGNQTERPICNSYERNIIVDHFGMARLCFSRNFPGMQLEKDGDLIRFWKGRETEKTRMAMRNCKLLCGISHSVRRESATLASRQPGDMDGKRTASNL